MTKDFEAGPLHWLPCLDCELKMAFTFHPKARPTLSPRTTCTRHNAVTPIITPTPTKNQTGPPIDRPKSPRLPDRKPNISSG